MANTTDYSRLLDGYALLAIKEYIKNNYAAKSHTHTKSQITDFPSSMPANGGTSDYTNYLNITSTRLGNGSNKLQFMQYSGATDNPSNDWYSHIIMHHANSAGYYTEIATHFHGDNVYFRRKTNGTVGEWKRLAFAGESQPASDVYAWAKASTKPSYTHNEIGAGNLTIGDGANRLMFRTNNSYANGIYYSTPGNEALVFATKYSVTSWIFATTDPTQQAAWTGLTPSLQIKNGRVTINKLIAGGTDAAYNLDVNGTLNATTIYQNGTALATVATSGSYNDLSNKPSAVLYASQTLTDAQKTQARSNIGAGTSSFTGYTSSNKLHTNYINNAAGWTSVTESTVSGWGFTKNAGTVTQVKVGTTAYNPSSGIVSLPAYPTKSSWNYDDVYVKLTGNQSISGTKTFTGKVELSDGQNSYAFSPGQGGDALIELIDEQSNKTTVYLMNPNTPSTAQYIALRSWVGDNYAAKSHTHTLSITSGGSSPTTLSANTTYTLTAGGSTLVFKTPPATSGNYLPLSGGTITGALGVTQGVSIGYGVVPYSPQNNTNFYYGYIGCYIQQKQQQVDVIGDAVALYTSDIYRDYSTVLAVHNDGYGIALKAHFAYTDSSKQAVQYDRDSYNPTSLSIYAESLYVYPNGVVSSLSNKYARIGVVEHNVKLTYSTTLYVRFNFRGDSQSETAATNTSTLASKLYYAGHRSAATALHCSGRYTNYQYCVTAIYAYSTTSLRLIYLSTSGVTDYEYSIPSNSTVSDTLTYKLVA